MFYNFSVSRRLRWMQWNPAWQS